MKWFIPSIGIWILIDKINISIVKSCTWKLTPDRYIIGSSNKYKDQLLHRIIAKRMGLDLSNEIDHKNGDLLNNQLSNLRPATHSQNMKNRKIHSNNKSGFKGVSWKKDKQKYRGIIRVNGNQIHLGYFDDPKKAYAAYCEAAIKYFGEFVRTEEKHENCRT